LADFVKCPEVEVIGERLIQVWPSLLGHIDPDRILWARDMGPVDPRGTKAVGSCIRVIPPYTLLNPDVCYIIAIRPRAKWDEVTRRQQAALVMHELLHIPEEFGVGALRSHDVMDFSILVDTLGSDYFERRDLPDLLAGEALQDVGLA